MAIATLIEKKILQKLNAIESMLAIIFFHAKPDKLTAEEKKQLDQSRQEFEKGEYVEWKPRQRKV